MEGLVLHDYKDPELFNFGIVNADNRKIEAAVNGAVPWAAMSNPNMLINWYFADPINQRRKSEYSSSGYTVDRWYKQVNLSYDVSTQLLSSDANTANTAFYQQGEDASLIGKVCTQSVLVYGTGKFRFMRGNTNLKNLSSSLMLYTQTYTVPQESRGYPIYGISLDKNTNLYLVAAKLELGDHQTLAHQDANGNWVLNDPPPDKALELVKCQRYFINFKSNPSYISTFGYITSAASIYRFTLALPTPLRSVPSLIGTPLLEVRLPSGGFSTRFPLSGAIADSYSIPSSAIAENYIDIACSITTPVDINNIPISVNVSNFALDAEIY